MLNRREVPTDDLSILFGKKTHLVSIQAEASEVEEVVEGFPSVVIPRSRGFALDCRAWPEEGTGIPRVLRGDPFGHRFHALESAAWIEG